MTINKALYSSQSEEWQTPKWLFDQLNEEFNFVLDPCTTKDNPLQTPFFFTKQDNGLNKNWNLGGNVFVNPPYNRSITKWLEKAIHEIKYNDDDKRKPEFINWSHNYLKPKFR